MKKIAFLSIISILSLCLSCNDNKENKTNQESQTELLSSSSIEEISTSSDKEIISSVESTTQDKQTNELDVFGNFLDELVFDDDLFKNDSLEIGVNEKYNLNVMCTLTDFSWIEMRSSNNDVAFYDVNNNILGKSLGSAIIAVMVDDYYDIIHVEVKDDGYIQQNLILDPGRLYNKAFTILGDSISDNSVSAYDNPPFKWGEQLQSLYGGKIYNYAKSGSTCGMCRRQMEKVPSARSIITTHMINLQMVKEAIRESDFVYIFIGANDATFGTNIGKIGDINDDNIDTYESFKGSYSYVVNKIREINPQAKIIAIGITYSTWGIEPYANNNYEDFSYAKSRAELDLIIKDMATELNLKYIYTYDLWNNTNWQSYIPDGIHPITEGYNLIVDRIVE